MYTRNEDVFSSNAGEKSMMGWGDCNRVGGQNVTGKGGKSAIKSARKKMFSRVGQRGSTDKIWGGAVGDTFSNKGCLSFQEAGAWKKNGGERAGLEVQLLLRLKWQMGWERKIGAGNFSWPKVSSKQKKKKNNGTWSGSGLITGGFVRGDERDELGLNY